MTSFNPPPHPAPRDSEPAPAPSLPADSGLWGEADLNALRGPAVAFSTQAPERADQRQPTIGHIGRYALKHRLGEGGLGTVYAAQDPLLSRLIAVKTLNLEVPESERAAFNALFLNEARAAAGLNHAHIVTVFDAGLSDNRAYIAMELLKGRDLGQLRREGWRPTPSQAALIVRRVADALGYAHGKGVVHRDVKPANIFMIGRVQPKVLDFGIARIAHRHDPHGAGTELAAGSPYYMAPEQVRQEPVDRRADVFSLGVVLYELLTDVKPFRGGTLDEITRAVLEHEPPLASTVDAAVPRALAEIVAKALAKNPDDRYRSARSLSRDLRHWIEDDIGAQAGEPAADAAAPNRARWIAGGVLAAAVLGGLVWTLRPGAPPAATLASAARPAVIATPAAAPVVTPGPAPAAAPAAAAAADASMPAATSPPSAAPAEPAPSAAAGLPAAKPMPAAPTRAAAPKESARERRAREAREREARLAALQPAAPVMRGIVRIAVSPWGEVEVDGKPVGASPPLTELSLSEGRHQIVIRNTDLPPLSMAADVSADRPVVVKHKF